MGGRLVTSPDMIRMVREARDIAQQGRRCIQDGRKEIEERGEKDDLEEREIRIDEVGLVITENRTRRMVVRRRAH